MRSKSASTVIEGDLIKIISTIDDKRWRLSAKVAPEADLTKNSFCNECFTHQNKAFFHAGGSFLHQKEDGVYLEKEVPALNRYISFRSEMKDFLKELNLWSEVFLIPSTT